MRDFWACCEQYVLQLDIAVGDAVLVEIVNPSDDLGYHGANVTFGELRDSLEH